jgi:DNA ligase-1
MMTIPEGFKPLLAVEHSKVKTQSFPYYLSEKLDGIRCIVFGGVGYSRSLKPIPNAFIQSYFNQYANILEGLDGELIIGDKNASDVFNQSTSGVMRQSGEPDFTFWVFDKYISGTEYTKRIDKIPVELPDRIKFLPQFYVTKQHEVDEWEAYFLKQGAEGVMLKTPHSVYKCGRSGTKTPELQKVKRFVDNEFQIIGWEPKYTNTNEAKTNELGRTMRSTAKDGMVALDTMGSLILCTSKGDTFSCGSGMTDAIRADLWERREKLSGQLAKVKYFDVGTGYNVPRFPVLVGIRHKDDL